MTPEQLARSGTEHAHQRAVFCWAALNKRQHPELEWMFAIPNGGKRDKITAGKLKAEGVKAGVPDICLPVVRGGYGALYIELKKVRNKELGRTKGTAQSNQKDWIKGLQACGQGAIVAYGWEEAVDIITRYLEQ